MSILQKDFDLEDVLLINFINLSSTEKDLVITWRNHRNVRKWMYQDHIISFKKHSKFIEKLKEENKNFYWLIKNKNAKYLGVIYLNKVDFIHRHAYLGIYSNPALKGVGKLLIQTLKELAFKFAKLHTLKLEVIETNEQAIKFYREHGFRKEGNLKEFVYKEGRWLDVLVMGIVNK